MVSRYDFIQLKAEVTPEGWIKDTPIITRAGIFEYRSPGGKVVRELRSDEQVFAAKTLASLNGIPITVDHSGMVSANNAEHIIGTVISAGQRQDTTENCIAEVIVHRPTKLGNRRDLSLGYTCDIDDTPGEYKGQRYDQAQINIVYNHLAGVRKGRAGNARLRLDSTDAVHGEFDTEDEDMPDNTRLINVRLDGIDYQSSPEVANALTKAQQSLADLQKRYDTIEADRDKLKGDVTTAETKLKDQVDDIRNEIKDRVALEGTAAKHAVKFDADDTVRTLKEKIVGKLRPEMKFDGKSDDYVNSAYDLTMAAEIDKDNKVNKQYKRLDGQNAKPGQQPNVQSGAAAARQAMLDRINGVKPEGKAA